MENQTKKLEILVVEDTKEFGGNALKAYEGSVVVLAKTRQEAADVLAKKSFDYIVSDIQFPEKEGEDPKDNSGAMLKLAEQYVIPIAFVTRANHHYFLQGNEDCILEVTLNPANVLYINKESKQGFVKDVIQYAGNLHPVFGNRISKYNLETKTEDVYKKALENLKVVSEDENDRELINAMKQQKDWRNKNAKIE